LEGAALQRGKKKKKTKLKTAIPTTPLAIDPGGQIPGRYCKAPGNSEGWVGRRYTEKKGRNKETGSFSHHRDGKDQAKMSPPWGKEKRKKSSDPRKCLVLGKKRKEQPSCRKRGKRAITDLEKTKLTRPNGGEGNDLNTTPELSNTEKRTNSRNPQKVMMRGKKLHSFKYIKKKNLLILKKKRKNETNRPFERCRKGEKETWYLQVFTS